MPQQKLCIFFSPATNADSLREDVAMLSVSDSNNNSFKVIVGDTVKAATALFDTYGADIAVVAAKAGGGTELGIDVLKVAKEKLPAAFRVLYSHSVSARAADRHWISFNNIAHMVSHVPKDIHKMLHQILREGGSGAIHCPVCGKDKLTQDEFWHHFFQFHSSEDNSATAGPCPICGEACGGRSKRTPLAVHIHNTHAPKGEHVDTKSHVQLVSFGLCVIQRKSDGKFLLVQEFCNQGFWLPGGGIDPGENPVAAAKREALEEAGVDVEITGLLRVEVNPTPARMGGGYIRMRFIFFGHPKDESAKPKTFPDYESLGAVWVTADDVISGKVVLRGEEPVTWFRYIIGGGAIPPISIMGFEGEDPPPF